MSVSGLGSQELWGAPEEFCISFIRDAQTVFAVALTQACPAVEQRSISAEVINVRDERGEVLGDGDLAVVAAAHAGGVVGDADRRGRLA